MRRPNVDRTVDMCNGPGKLTRALGIGRDNNGDDLVRSRIRIVDDGIAPPMFPDQSVRIGISEAGRQALALVGSKRPARQQATQTRHARVDRAGRRPMEHPVRPTEVLGTP